MLIYYLYFMGNPGTSSKIVQCFDVIEKTKNKNTHTHAHTHTHTHTKKKKKKNAFSKNRLGKIVHVALMFLISDILYNGYFRSKNDTFN